MIHTLMQVSYGGSSGSGNDAAAGAVGLLMAVLFVAIGIAIAVAIWGTIFKKAGYSFWMGLLMIIPLVNLIWFLIFVFSKWPIHHELERYRQQVGYAGGGFPVGGQPPPPMR
ncbi:MAG: hypothetical protein QOF78_1454 [Phycisphaerales bacterium]|nr:hypothetical protein [Phycisphaerales bacterium]